MKKVSFVSVVVSGIAMLALMIGGGTGCSGGTSDNANVAKGKAFLAEGNGDSARTIFNSELTADPDSCGGLYGRILADVQVLSKEATDLITTGGGLFATEYAPYASAATSTDLYQMINPLLTPFVDIFEEMEEDTDRVVELNCTFHTDSYMVSLYTDASQSEPVANAVLSGKWNKAEALMIGGEVHMALALVDFISAHSLKVNMASLQNVASLIDIEDLLNQVQGGYQTNQLIYQARSLGALLEDNPDLLTKSADRWDLMENVPQELAEGFSELNAIFDALKDAKGDPSDAILGFVDKDNNGFDAGDEVTFGIKQATVSGGTTMLEGLRIVIPDLFTSSFVQNARDLLDKATESLETVGGSSSGGRIGLSDITPILTVFSDKIGSMIPSVVPSIIPSLQIPSIPDVIEVDLKAFFSDPKPLRDFMPVIQNHELVIEGETDPAGVPDGMAIVAGDSSHFLGADLIQADCITALADTVVNPIPYIQFSDPSFNGLLWINLAPVQDMENVSACTGPSGYSTYKVADQYSLNKLIAGLLVSVSTVPDLGFLF